MGKILIGFMVLAVCVGLLWTRMRAAQENPRRGGLPRCEANLNTCNADLAVCINAPQSRVLATGQNVAFKANKNDGDGGMLDNVDDDGTLQIGVPLQYVDNGDGTVTDLNTGLIWEMKLAADGSDGGNCDDGNQANRDLHCLNNVYRWSGDGLQETIWDWLDDVNAENYAGRNDWRIPNNRELPSIVDHGRATPRPIRFWVPSVVRPGRLLPQVLMRRLRFSSNSTMAS